VQLQRIFKGSDHNFRASAFHQHCDNKGPTLSVILSDKDRLFGGFTKVNWSNKNSEYVTDNEAFLVQLNERVKLKNTDTNYSIYNRTDYMCSFGGGHDLHICD
jgi:hypothetical protein